MILRSFLAAVSVLIATHAIAEDMKLAVTTSFHNSGLSDILVPAIKADTGLQVHLLVVGTGQALRLGKAGDVDAILVHSKAAEEAFVVEGFAPHRREIMFNDFVLIGPANDPAQIGNAKTAAEALGLIQGARAAFVSRGDDSGTHKKEVTLWAGAGVTGDALKNGWYRAVGAGMGAALNVASGMNAYILSDRASWLNFANRGDLALLFSGDPVLFNQYAYLPVSVQKHPHVKGDAAAKLEAWLSSDNAKILIDGYRLNGEQLFTFNARP